MRDITAQSCSPYGGAMGGLRGYGMPAPISNPL